MKRRKMNPFVLVSLMIFFLLYRQQVTLANPMVSAEQAILIDQATGIILYEKNAYNSQLIASITKVMTAIIAIEHGDLNHQIKVNQEAVLAEGSSIYLVEKEKMSLEDLLYGLMLRSGNDAAVAIADYIGGSVDGFVYLMNEKAEWLGLEQTSFANPHGLDADNHYSSAHDIAIIMRYAMENETFIKINQAKSHQAATRTYQWYNKNKLLTNYYPYAIGGKTGYTKAAGRTLVTVAEKNARQLIVVTINDPNDWFDHIRLYEWGFDQADALELITSAEFGQEYHHDEHEPTIIDSMIGYFMKMVGLIEWYI